MKIILRKAHVYLYMGSVALGYFLMWPFLYYFSRKPQRYPALNKFRRFLGAASSAFVGIFYSFDYEQAINWDRPYIICANHTSNLDISAMSILVKNNCFFMGKHELENGLVTGLFFRTVDIPVNRESKMSSFRAFKKAAERLLHGMSLIIFPEGKIADDYPPRLGEFKNGPFRLAIELKIPIIPVTSANTWQILWDTGTKFGSRPGVCKFKVGKPVETSELTIDDADSLRDKVYELMSAALKQQDQVHVPA